jgi:N6-adenosine-specific RNA methylase IME4
VQKGKVSVTAGAILSSAPKAEQAKILALTEREILAKAKEIKAAKSGERMQRKLEVVRQIESQPTPMPGGRFRVIVADPPWRYDTKAENTGAAVRGLVPYADMSIEQICALPVASLAEQHCVLWLWTTNAFMRQAYQCLDAWGFVEKTILTWDKERLGVGRWLRNQTEHCILAVRGKPVVTLSNQCTILRAPRREHSRKPDEFFALVESVCPGSKLEMFAREPRKGWSVWGGETTKFEKEAVSCRSK